MGRGVEDLSGRCHVKRMSRRKERLGFFVQLCLRSSEEKGSAHTRTPLACARSRSLARTRSLRQLPLIICQNASLIETICIHAGFRIHRSVAPRRSEREIPDVHVEESDGSQDRLHFDEWRSGN